MRRQRAGVDNGKQRHLHSARQWLATLCHFHPVVRLLLVSCFVLSGSSLYSQTVTATIDRDKILLGEQINLELKAENINLREAPLAGWFSLPDSINHLEVVKRFPVDTITIEGQTTYIQNITLTSFDSGSWLLPPLPLTLQGNGTDSLFTEALQITILPVDVSTLQQYHEMKDIIDVEAKPDYLLIAGIVISVMLLAAGTWYFFFRKKKTISPILKPAPARSLFESAIEQLEKLAKDNPPAPMFYNRLDDICRMYIQNQLYLRALQLTGDELMVQLNAYLQPEARSSFYQLIRLISAVKFARYQPAEPQKEADIGTAKAAIEHIYYHLQRSLHQHAS